MNTEHTAKALMAVCGEHRLRRYSILSHVYIIPIEDLGEGSRVLWNDSAQERQFNVRLGECAGAYLEREFKNRGTVLASSDLKDTVDIGISGGATVHSAIRALNKFELPKQARIAPLVLGPLPQMRYAPQTIGAILADRIANSDMEEMVEISIADPATFSHIPEVHIRVEEGGKTLLQQRAFDWLVTGIGSQECESFEAAKKIICTQQGGLPNAVGDVFSRFFDEGCEEVAGKKLNAFVVLEFDRLKSLASRSEKCRVIAIAGGRKKVPALKTLLRVDHCRDLQKREKLVNQGERLINTLITDELTAMAVLTK